MYVKFRNKIGAGITSLKTVHRKTSSIDIRLRNVFLLNVWYIAKLILFLCIVPVSCNNPPRFLIEGQTEIVIRLKEGEETPVGSLIYRLKGVDPDGDRLYFGVRNHADSNIIRVESTSSTEANVYLNKQLDRETRDEYALVLTLTDGRLGSGNYITQSLLLLVEDVNDCTPVFLPYQTSITIRENAPKTVIATLEATDADEGAYGQVLYHLQELDSDSSSLFSISTVGGKGIIRLIGGLDYEKRSLHQLRVLAVDRAKQGRVNTATAPLLINVQDVEDQPPEFVRVIPVARVSEDATIGTTVLQVTAVDGDRGVNNKIEYTLLTNMDDAFEISPGTGVVRTAKALDRENIEGSGAYILRIIATEVGTAVMPAPTASTEVTVIVTDVNDETPTFRSPRYECEVAENAQTNTPLTFIGNVIPEVYDFDQGKNGTFDLFLRGDRGMFEVTPHRGINEASFLIRVRNSEALDYEKLTEMNLTLIAKETAEKNTKQSEVGITVYIRDVNDNFPEFTQSLYEVSVPENCEVGTTVAWVQALDEDSGTFGSKGVRYTHLTGSIEDLLHLNPVTGVITVKSTGSSSWDREFVSMHYLTVEARDDLGRGNRNTVQLLLHIEDVNDNAPVFTQSRYEARLKENDWMFETPLKVEARDADLNGTKNSQLEYSIDDGPYSQNFTINPVTGLITPLNPLDFESLNTLSLENVQPLSLTIKASDFGRPRMSTSVPVVIYLQDINDHNPRFEQPFYKRSIPENTASGTVIMEVRAFDEDGSEPNNRIVYRIESGALDKFVIDAESGTLSVARGATLDPDQTDPRRTNYALRVLALDGASGDGQLKATVTVNITIEDVNNKPPLFDDPGTIYVKENVPVGTIIKKIVAKDLDSDAKLRYKVNVASCEARSERGVSVPLTDYNYLAAFRLDSVSGLLTVVKMLDRETIEMYKLAVTVEDDASVTGLQTASSHLTIIVEDINDNNPKFRKPFYRFSVTENSKNGVSIGSVLADDADKNRTIKYALGGSRDMTDLLHLDLHTGEIFVANRIDHEQYNWLNLTVTATDSGVPPRYSRAEVFIQILDENDNNPMFGAEPRSLSIAEDTAVGREVATLSAQDADSGDYGHITYLLDRISSQGVFSLDPESGVLKINSELDREKRSSYLLVVEAWDNYQFGFANGESRNTFKQINVTIVDVNDNAPQLHLPNGCVTITEFQEENTQITLIHSSDPDDSETPNGRTVLDIVDGNHLGLFDLRQIDEWSAEVVVAKSLKGHYGNYSLSIQAEDLGAPPHQSQGELLICVTDFNDHAPVFISPPHNTTLRVPENATVGSTLIQIIAKDEDIGLNGAVRYRLKMDPAGSWRAFTIQPVSGLLELRQPLDRTKQKIYDIRIEAYDLGSPTSLSSDLDVTIYVTNINDYQPQFMMDQISINFTENVTPGFEQRLLPSTIDRDELEFDGPPTPICYYIVGGNEAGLFKMNKETHHLMIIKELDREEQDSHLLLVKASEDCINAPANQSFFDTLDDTLLKVFVTVSDINDNAPKFIHRIFTGGVSTAASFGTQFMSIKAEDADFGENAQISYYLIGDVQMTLTEGLDNLKRSPFLVDPETGTIQLNFDPQQGMKGYFDFMVLANDTGSLEDTARVFIYLLREDQRVRFVLRQHPPELRHRIESFREVLENVTGAIVNVDEFRLHVNQDGSVDKTKTDLYLHLVDRKDNSIFDVEDVLRLVDENTEKLDNLFKDFNVLDTQAGGPQALGISTGTQTTLWLTASSLFLAMLLFLCLALCISQRQTYQRKLKAATTTAYGSDLEGRGLSGLSGRVPNTNKHSMEGSNPIWLQAYENEWYKHTDDFSQGSAHDSLDENEVSSGSGSHCNQDQDQDQDRTEASCPQNVYQTLQPQIVKRKLETTEL